ncbi:hypothetical protein Baya_9313 [Bagarius yarrelli]|uniref:Uncharacterized protein n=1 Tax=Bagarius yarrelli TaxID=175774 RepID=A0A556U632_BAGYA|nr:hypothetical protein Baya_9313 [Bagarius yarrelli]
MRERRGRVRSEMENDVFSRAAITGMDEEQLDGPSMLEMLNVSSINSKQVLPFPPYLSFIFSPPHLDADYLSHAAVS